MLQDVGARSRRTRGLDTISGAVATSRAVPPSWCARWQPPGS